MDKVMCLKWRVISAFHALKYEWFPEHFPFQIPVRKPKPSVYCPECGKLLDKLMAYHTGDGWAFFWEHDDDCGSEAGWEVLDGWYPFVFGVPCKRSDLSKIGIMEA